MSKGRTGLRTGSGQTENIAGALMKEVQYTATGIYFLLIFLMFPLYLEDHYWRMAFCKWRFYLYTTLPYLGVMLLSGLPAIINHIKRRQRPRLSVCDLMVGCYGCLMLLTFAFGGNRQASWMGVDGWYMGVAAQLLFVTSYFVISRSRFSAAWLLGCNLAGGGICFLIGIFQRLGQDFLHLYYGMPDVVVSDFLSTIGNRTWMSAYVCTVFPIGVYFFWRAEKPGQRLLWGLYAALAFIGLAATYSDSAYVGLAAVFFVLGVLSLGSGRKMISFCYVLCLWFSSGLAMCGVRMLCGDRVRDERGLTCYVYNWRWMLAGLAFSVLLTGLVRLYYSRKPKGLDTVMPEGRRRRLRRGCLASAVAVCGLLILFIVLNTTGVLERLFHVTVRSSYLYFDDTWGDMRGWTWKMVCKMFGELPLLRKLFGVGADCFAHYSYGNVKYAGVFHLIWNDTVLTNAHNEWLNMFFCQGILGGLAYLGIFVSMAFSCLRRAENKLHPLVPALGLCVVAYCFHNVFCYQQICATGPIFVLMGAAASLLRGEREDAGER